jgi:K+-sensing histidine kinase KdpD
MHLRTSYFKKYHFFLTLLLHCNFQVIITASDFFVLSTMLFDYMVLDNYWSFNLEKVSFFVSFFTFKYYEDPFQIF